MRLTDVEAHFSGSDDEADCGEIAVWTTHDLDNTGVELEPQLAFVACSGRLLRIDGREVDPLDPTEVAVSCSSGTCGYDLPLFRTEAQPITIRYTSADATIVITRQGAFTTMVGLREPSPECAGYDTAVFRATFSLEDDR